MSSSDSTSSEDSTVQSSSATQTDAASTTPSTTTQTVKVRQPTRLRDWLLPRSVLGITSLLLSFALGAALSGAVLYSYYNYRLTNTDRRIDSYIKGFDGRFRTANETLDNVKQNAQADIQKELEPLRQFQSEGGTTTKLVEKVSKSVWFVQTLDENGAPSVGSSFVVESTGGQSVLVTSFNTVRAATRTPGPEIYVSNGNDKIKAKLESWVDNQDLAVLTIGKGDLPKLEWVSQSNLPHIGERTFVASGFGSAGASVTQGFVTDVPQNAIQISAPVGPQFQGGPLLNSDGKVTGVASMNYSPFGFASSSSVTYSIPIRLTCEKLLRCPDGNNSGGGAQ